MQTESFDTLSDVVGTFRPAKRRGVLVGAPLALPRMIRARSANARAVFRRRLHAVSCAVSLADSSNRCNFGPRGIRNSHVRDAPKPQEILHELLTQDTEMPELMMRDLMGDDERRALIVGTALEQAAGEVDV
jgi:hypothetical protein